MTTATATATMRCNQALKNKALKSRISSTSSEPLWNTNSDVYIFRINSSSSSLLLSDDTKYILGFGILRYPISSFLSRLSSKQRQKYKNRKKEQKTHTLPCISHIMMSHKCMQKRRTNVIACKLKRQKNDQPSKQTTHQPTHFEHK